MWRPTYDLVNTLSQPAGRITFLLYNNVVPKTAENFRYEEYTVMEGEGLRGGRHSIELCDPERQVQVELSDHHQVVHVDHRMQGLVYGGERDGHPYGCASPLRGVLLPPYHQGLHDPR